MCPYGSGTWIRTGDTSGMNRMLWPTELCRHMLFKQHRDFIRRQVGCQQKLFLFSRSGEDFLCAAGPFSPLRRGDRPWDRRWRRPCASQSADAPPGRSRTARCGQQCRSRRRRPPTRPHRRRSGARDWRTRC